MMARKRDTIALFQNDLDEVGIYFTALELMLIMDAGLGPDDTGDLTHERIIGHFTALHHILNKQLDENY